MDRGAFLANGAASAPTAPAVPSADYPTDGVVLTSVPPTEPGAYWFHMITEEIRQVIVGAGLTPDYTDLTQLYAAVQALAGGVVKCTTAAQAYSLYGQYTFAHTLGVAPGVVQLKARCLTAEGGYSVGDVVLLGASHTDDTGGSLLGWVVKATATDIYLSFDKNHGFNFHEWNNDSQFTVTPGRWELFFFALA